MATGIRERPSRQAFRPLDYFDGSTPPRVTPRIVEEIDVKIMGVVAFEMETDGFQEFADYLRDAATIYGRPTGARLYRFRFQADAWNDEALAAFRRYRDREALR